MISLVGLVVAFTTVATVFFVGFEPRHGNGLSQALFVKVLVIIIIVVIVVWLLQLHHQMMMMMMLAVVLVGQRHFGKHRVLIPHNHNVGYLVTTMFAAQHATQL